VSVRGSLIGHHPTDLACTSQQRERRLNRPVRCDSRRSGGAGAGALPGEPGLAALALRDQRAEQFRVAEQVQVAYVMLRNMGVSSAPDPAGFAGVIE